MKRMTKILTAALMTSSFAAAPALAGSVGADAGASIGMKNGTSTATTSGSAGTSVTDPALGVNAAAETTSRDGADASKAEILAAIGDNTNAASDISAVTDASDVNIVELGSAAEVSAEDIDQAVSQNEDAVSKLRTSLQANSGVWNKLESEGVELSSVVAAKTDAEGSVTVYVR
ncbi:hypothetical protein [Hoeflea ulvae]|uniref:Nicotinate phosphoribosyltransferase n=1 Tax=Hoeflea ulvae TaxID=2983764 RepID=A0ABT3YDU1_9HYPH|nr:hypothetical protein [Hoeflea ulvae]MCY0094054.1 hypothetical protein [Hoeflea ulvae]